MSEKPDKVIHLLGLPKAHNPFGRRLFIDPQGTLGDWRIQGSGYVLYNYTWYLVLNTGMDSGLNYIFKLLEFPETYWVTQKPKEIEVGIFNRDARSGQQACFMLGTGSAMLYTHQRVGDTYENCAFWLIGSGTLRGDLTIYARTQDRILFQETEIETIPYPERRTLRIEWTASKIYYFVDNVLRATHNAYSWDEVSPTYIKLENSCDQTKNASICFYPVRMFGDW